VLTGSNRTVGKRALALPRDLKRGFAGGTGTTAKEVDRGLGGNPGPAREAARRGNPSSWADISRHHAGDPRRGDMARAHRRRAGPKHATLMRRLPLGSTDWGPRHEWISRGPGLTLTTGPPPRRRGKNILRNLPRAQRPRNGLLQKLLPGPIRTLGVSTHTRMRGLLLSSAPMPASVKGDTDIPRTLGGAAADPCRDRHAKAHRTGHAVLGIGVDTPRGIGIAEAKGEAKRKKRAGYQLHVDGRQKGAATWGGFTPRAGGQAVENQPTVQRSLKWKLPGRWAPGVFRRTFRA